MVDDIIGTGDTLRTVAALVTETRPIRLREAAVVANTVNCAPQLGQATEPIGRSRE